MTLSAQDVRILTALKAFCRAIFNSMSSGESSILLANAYKFYESLNVCERLSNFTFIERTVSRTTVAQPGNISYVCLETTSWKYFSANWTSLMRQSVVLAVPRWPVTVRLSVLLVFFAKMIAFFSGLDLRWGVGTCPCLMASKKFSLKECALEANSPRFFFTLLMSIIA